MRPRRLWAVPAAVRTLLAAPFAPGTGWNRTAVPKGTRANTCVSASCTNARIPPFCQKLLALFYPAAAAWLPGRHSK